MVSELSTRGVRTVEHENFLPPRVSISLRTAIIHSFIFSGCSNINNIEGTIFGVLDCPPNLDKKDLSPPSALEASAAICKTCRTNGLPGTRSDANATDCRPSLIILSGRRSDGPSNAYSRMWPVVTKT